MWLKKVDVFDCENPTRINDSSHGVIIKDVVVVETEAREVNFCPPGQANVGFVDKKELLSLLLEIFGSWL